MNHSSVVYQNQFFSGPSYRGTPKDCCDRRPRWQRFPCYIRKCCHIWPLSQEPGNCIHCAGITFRPPDMNKTDFGAENAVLWEMDNSYKAYLEPHPIPHPHSH